MRPRLGRRLPSVQAGSREEALALLPGLPPGTVIVDVEHTVASGDRAHTLREHCLAIESTLNRSGHSALFASNARLARDLHPLRAIDQALKPFTSTKRLPAAAASPLVAVWGDQVLTDGILARRLGLPFVKQRQVSPGLKTRFLGVLGAAVEPALFRRTAKLLARSCPENA